MRRLGTLLILAGAAVLVASLFFDWYREDVSPIDVEGQGEIVLYNASAYSGWSSFEIVDIVLLLCAAGAVAAVARPMRLPSGALMVLSASAAVLVALQAVNVPPVFQLEDDYNALRVVRETGLWLGLGGSLAMLGGEALRRASVR